MTNQHCGWEFGYIYIWWVWGQLEADIALNRIFFKIMVLLRSNEYSIQERPNHDPNHGRSRGPCPNPTCGIHVAYFSALGALLRCASLFIQGYFRKECDSRLGRPHQRPCVTTGADVHVPGPITMYVHTELT